MRIRSNALISMYDRDRFFVAAVIIVSNEHLYQSHCIDFKMNLLYISLIHNTMEYFYYNEKLSRIISF